MEPIWILVIATVLVALAFDVINGFHDAANSIATVVSTRVLSPRWAVLWAAFFNFVAMFIFAPKVADTISKIVRIDAHDPTFVWVILCGLLGAVVWDLLTWWWGLPTSSSHALIGGFAGAALVKGGIGALVAKGILKIGLFIVLSPTIGLLLAFAIMFAVMWLFRKNTPLKIDKRFRH